MTQKQIFKEFIALGYDGPGTRIPGLTDVQLAYYVIARITSTGCTVINLLSGTTIHLPIGWIDLFESLNTWGGNRILKALPEDKIDKTILNFQTLNVRMARRQGEYFMNTLSEICTTGTLDFREWLKSECKLRIKPIEFSSLDKYKEI